MARAATATRSRASTPARKSSTSTALARRPATVSKKKYEDLQERAKRLASKAREALKGNTQEDALIAVGSAMLLAAAEKEGHELPTVANLDPALIYGALLAVVAPQFVSGPWSQRVESAGVGLLTVAAHRSMMRGSVKTKSDDAPAPK